MNRLPAKNLHNPTSTPHTDAVGDPMTMLICTDKINGSGEDAIPYMTWRPHMATGVIAVFDGLGGSGSMKYRDNQTIRTGAYLGARTSRQAVKSFYLQQTSQTPRIAFTQSHLTQLQHRIMQTLKEALQSVQAIESGIQSSMRRVLPTTMASVFYVVESTQCIVDVVWAGDSRVYCLSPQGLQQLTRDDVVPTTHSSFDDVMQDAPLTNCIRADAPFTLNHRQYTLPIPCAIMAVSDGCYGYTASPMHFELQLLNTLNQSTSMATWQALIEREFRNTSQDDYSMGLICLGWPNIIATKQSIQSRFLALTELISPINHLEERIRSTSKSSQEYATLVQQRTHYLAHIWNTYRMHYFSKLEENSNV
jgi:hypothetical protein